MVILLINFTPNGSRIKRFSTFVYQRHDCDAIIKKENKNK